MYDTHGAGDSVALITRRGTPLRLAVLKLSTGALVGDVLDVQMEALSELPVDLPWSPDGRRLALTSFTTVTVLDRNGRQLSATVHGGGRRNVRWSPDGTPLHFFRFTASTNDDLIAISVASNGEMGKPRVLLSQVPTLLQGTFDVSRRSGRIIFGVGFEFSDVWQIDASQAVVASQRLTQGSSWYSPPRVAANGRSVTYRRSDALGNNLYRNTDGLEAAITGARNVVERFHRWSIDEDVASFETYVDFVPRLFLSNVREGTSRPLARDVHERGWQIATNGEIIWMRRGRSAIRLSNAAGTDRRLVVPQFGDAGDVFTGNNWQLSPDGSTLAVSSTSASGDSVTIHLVPLAGDAPRRLPAIATAGASIPLAGWPAHGWLQLAVHPVSGSAVTVLSVDLKSGATQQLAVLPQRCAANTVDYSPSVRRAACVVLDSRADLMMIDGLRP